MIELIIDASQGILGRIAAFAAKQSLLGKNIIIINCNQALITGRKQDILQKYKNLKAKGGASLKGPRILKSPERIMKRTIRGMLSHKQARGSQALKRIMCYNETPEEFKDKEAVTMKRELKNKAITLQVLSREL